MEFSNGTGSLQSREPDQELVGYDDGESSAGAPSSGRPPSTSLPSPDRSAVTMRRGTANTTHSPVSRGVTFKS